MPNQQDSPFKPLWKKQTRQGRTKYTGVAVVEGQEYWINVFPNTDKWSEKQPDFHFSLQPKE